MKKNKDYIIFPLDFPTVDDAKKYVDLLAQEVGMFKVGLELFIKAGPQFIKYILNAGKAGVFLDLKLYDIPVTVLGAVKSIAKLDVTFATVHCSESNEMLKAAVQGSGGEVGILGVTVLTSVSNEDIKNAGFRDKYANDISKLVIKRAQMAKDAKCAGVVCSGLESKIIKKHFGNNLLIVTPGIRPEWSITKNDDQCRITTPAQAIYNGSDYLVIGRPIRDANDPVEAVKKIIQEIELGLTKQGAKE